MSRINATGPMDKNPKFQLNYLDRKNRIIDLSYYPNVEYDFHCDRNPRISIILSGELKETVGFTDVFAQTASLVIKPSSVAHKNKFGPKGTRIISYILDEAFIKSLFPAGMSPWRWFQGLPYSRAIWQFLFTLRNAPSEHVLKDSLIQLIAVLVETSLTPVKLKPDWLDRITEKIDEEYMDTGMRLQLLAGEAGVHPIYLARAFRKFHNCSVKDYVQRLRLQNAMHQLASSKELIAQIAYQEGFSDQSHLSRYFKSTFGLSPARFRKFVQSYYL